MRRALLLLPIFVVAFLSGAPCPSALGQTPSPRRKVDFRKWRPRALEHELGLSYQLLLRPEQDGPSPSAVEPEEPNNSDPKDPHACVSDFELAAPEDQLFPEAGQGPSLRQGLALRYQFTIHPLVAVGSQVQLAFPPLRDKPGNGLLATDGFVLLQWPRFNLVPSIFAGAGVVRRLSRGGPSALSLLYGARLALAISARTRVAFEFRDQLLQTNTATSRGLQHLLQFSLGISLRLGRHAPRRPKPPIQPVPVTQPPKPPQVEPNVAPPPAAQDICHGDLHDRPECNYVGPSDAESRDLVDASLVIEPPENALTIAEPLPRYTALRFDLNSAQLKPVHRTVLDELAKFTHTHPEVLVLITGHTDRLGGTHQNFDLSLARARAVAAYLEAQGLASARLITHAMSEIEARDSRGTEGASHEDRRVELRLLRP